MRRLRGMSGVMFVPSGATSHMHLKTAPAHYSAWIFPPARPRKHNTSQELLPGRKVHLAGIHNQFAQVLLKSAASSLKGTRSTPSLAAISISLSEPKREYRSVRTD